MKITSKHSVCLLISQAVVDLVLTTHGIGVNFMEKTISIRNTEITFSIWDLGGQREFVNMLPLVCNDAVAILFMFDLTRKSTLNSIKEWYRQGRGFNKTAIPFLIGTKYDHFVNFPKEDQEEISNQARRFAKAMRASLIFSSTSHSINVQKVRICESQDASISFDKMTDLCLADFQDRAVQGIRPKMYNSRDRKCWRTSTPLSDGMIVTVCCGRRKVHNNDFNEAHVFTIKETMQCDAKNCGKELVLEHST